MRTGDIRDLGIRPPLAETRPGAPGVDGGAASGPSFGEALEDALRTVDGNLTGSEARATEYVGGGNVDLHNVIIDLERADLNLRTMIQVRNKLLEAYKEVMRIPV